MPPKSLNMADCSGIADLSPLSGIETFQSVILPPNSKGFEFLRGLPALTKLSFSYDPAANGPRQTAAEFWAAYDRNGATTKPAPDPL